MLKRSHRAQVSGTSAAVLVAIITVLIIIYILFLPPKERAELLGENISTIDGISISGNATLLSVSPGRLDYLPQKEVEHTLPTVNLFTTTKAEVLESRQSLYVKNAWFDKSFANMTFSVSDLPNTKNVMLVFNVKKYSGRLLLKLNGYDIVDNEYTTPNIEPIQLPERLLKDVNTIEVSVSGVGWRFWRTNEYILEDIKIAADITDISTREATIPFQVSSTEKNNLDRVYVKFFADCEVKEVGPLNIYLNTNRIFSSVPDCGIARSLEVSPYLLLSGDNTLIFKTEKGSYLIDNIIVKSQLKAMTYPTYYFEANESVYDNVVDGKIDVVLYFEFVDDIEKKKAELWINNHQRGFDTTAREYTMNINTLIKEGNNVIEIKPKAILDIVNMKVYVQKK